MDIKPTHFINSYRQGRLAKTLTPAQIDKTLKVPRDTSMDTEKMRYQWTFTADGHECCIWDYKRCKWSCFGPAHVFEELFGVDYTFEHK